MLPDGRPLSEARDLLCIKIGCNAFTGRPVPGTKRAEPYCARHGCRVWAFPDDICPTFHRLVI